MSVQVCQVSRIYAHYDIYGTHPLDVKDTIVKLLSTFLPRKVSKHGRCL